MSEFLIKAGQIVIASAVMFAAIYAQETLNYPINGYLIGAWAFMAAYGATLLAVRLIDRRVRLGRILPRLGGKKAAD